MSLRSNASGACRTAGSRWARPNRVRRNAGFMKEVREAARLAQQYGLASLPPVGDLGETAVSGETS